MKLVRVTFIITLIGILLLIFLSQAKPIQTGIISNIQTSQTRTVIQIEETQAELIIFETSNLNLKTGDKIKFKGKPDTYRNKKQIIIEKISLIK